MGDHETLIWAMGAALEAFEKAVVQEKQPLPLHSEIAGEKIKMGGRKVRIKIEIFPA